MTGTPPVDRERYTEPSRCACAGQQRRTVAVKRPAPLARTIHVSACGKIKFSFRAEKASHPTPAFALYKSSDCFAGTPASEESAGVSFDY
jgi:hypothetical protein